MTTEAVERPVAGEHRTVARVMAILEFVVVNDQRGARLGDLAEHVDAPKSSVHGLVKGLLTTGYLREAGGRYHVGPAISSLVVSEEVLVAASYRNALEELSERWGETAILSKLVGDSTVHLEIVEPKDAFIRAAPMPRTRLSLWPRSSGKCFLAYMDEKRLDAYFRRQRLDANTIATMRGELAEVRKTGVAVNAGGNTGIEMAVSSPIVNRTGDVVFAITLAGVASRMVDRLPEIKADVKAAAEALSQNTP